MLGTTKVGGDRVRFSMVRLGELLATSIQLGVGEWLSMALPALSADVAQQVADRQFARWIAK